MTTYLLNSAVITTPGVYSYTLISVDELRERIRERDFESYIGYAETAEAIATLTGVPIPLNRGTIKMRVGDEAIIFRLTSRVADPARKGGISIAAILHNCEIGILKKLSR